MAIGKVTDSLKRRMGINNGEVKASHQAQDSFYHHAATYCLLAPFLAFAANVFYGFAPQTQQEATLQFLMLGGILLSGIISGIISLFGIRKYGRHGILWKAIAGIMIFVFLVIIAVPAILHAQSMSRQRYEQIHGYPPL